MNCSFCILGSSDPPLVVELHCIGEGPVISVTPGQLDWGVCPVLTPIPKKLVLSNQSEIVAMFEAIFVSVLCQGLYLFIVVSLTYWLPLLR